MKQICILTIRLYLYRYVVELVDTLVSKSSAARREGSSPSVPTMGMHVTKDGELDLQSGCEGFDSLRLHYIGLSASLVCHGTVNALEIAGSNPAFSVILETSRHVQTFLVRHDIKMQGNKTSIKSLRKATACSSVGRAHRSGRRGRWFESTQADYFEKTSFLGFTKRREKAIITM